MNDCTGKIHEGVYNCYGEQDNSLCFECVHNSESEAEEKKNNFISQRDKINILYDYLLGHKLPEGVTCKMPKLSNNVAFSVIWFLQEIMHCLPDNIEQCDRCKQLYDAHSEGCYLDDQYSLNGKPLPKKYWGHWCENCTPCVEFELM